ncbi:MAG: rhodanese-like domain-containing protein [Synechococcales bacterium]|nr:rhodanese-like domain-containing protein [Synechococcales bacterium]
MDQLTMNDAIQHYSTKLAFETDSWDLQTALAAGENIIVIDARSPEAYQKEHLPNAINLPHRQMSQATTQHLDKTALVVTYCDGIGCNASTKGALHLARLGFRVKELMGDWTGGNEMVTQLKPSPIAPQRPAVASSWTTGRWTTGRWTTGQPN